MPKQCIILLNGPACSGKDTAAAFFRALGLPTFTQAEPIDECLKVLINHNEEAWQRMLSDKNHIFRWPGGAVNSLRNVRISFAEEWVKPRLGKGFFAYFQAVKIVAQSHPVNIVTDLGFKEELEQYIEIFGADSLLILQLARPGYEFSQELKQWHPGLNNAPKPRSRSYQNHPEVRTIRVPNGGTVEEFHDNLFTVYQTLRNQGLLS